MAGNQSIVADYARRLRLEPKLRRARLEAFAAENADFAPVFYHLSEEVSERRLGFQTLANQRDERRYLNQFRAADEAGGLLRHLIDQSLAEQWRSDAQQRLAASAGAETALTSPVSLSFSVSNSAYLASISIAEPARDILWRGSPDAPFVSTGSSGQQDPRTGAPAPRSFFELPLGQTDTTIEVAYIDFNGERQGPYAFPFAGKRESFNANRRLLEATTTSWLSFRDYEGKRLLYFTHLMTYRGGLDAIHYGLNQPQPDTPFTFPPWQQDGLAPIDATTPVYLEVPVTTEYATVQLTFKDGSQSGVQRINYR